MGMLMRRHTVKSTEDKSVDFNKLKTEELKAYALSKGIELPKDAKKAEIIDLLKEG